MWKRFVSYYKPHRKLFVADLLCAFLLAICDLLYPLIARNMINDYVPNQNKHMLLVAAMVLVGIYALKVFFNWFLQYWGHVCGLRIQADMRKDLFEHLEKLPFSYFDEHKTGTIMSRLVNDMMEIAELSHHGPEDLFLSSITIVGCFVLLCRINVSLTLIVFSVVPFIVLFAGLMRKSLRRASMLSREKTAIVNAEVETSIAGIRVSRSYTTADHEILKFNKANEDYKQAKSIMYLAMGYFRGGMEFLMDILYLIVLVAGGMFFFNGKISAGDFTAYLLYINNFLKPIQKIINIYEQFQDGMTGFKRFTDIMDEPEEFEKTDAKDVGQLEGNIAFRDVSFCYKDTKHDSDKIIDHLTFSVPAGKTVALVGPSGGGKTTICHLIPRFYEVNSGNITIDGIDIQDMKRLSLRKNIGMVAQDVFLFGGTIRDNIALGKLDASDEEIVDAAKKANIHDYIMTLPNGYQTDVGERGVKLSGGQKQRISIARVFLKNPPILILDEATSALDNATEMQIQQSLEQLSNGRTSLVVAHRLSTIKNADEIIVITKDGIQEHGTHEQLLAKQGVYANLYQYQFKEHVE